MIFLIKEVSDEKFKKIILNLKEYTKSKDLRNKIEKIAKLVDKEKDYILIDKEELLSLLDPKRVKNDVFIDNISI